MVNYPLKIKKRINTRVIGYDGVKIPDKLEGEF
jgi:hypothetical protein